MKPEFKKVQEGERRKLLYLFFSFVDQSLCRHTRNANLNDATLTYEILVKFVTFYEIFS
jgi:hypothetical protein